MNAEIEDGYREFVAGQLHPLLRTAYLLCGHWQTAEDLVQITLVQLYRSWPRIAGLEEPRAYARRVLTNAFVTAQRRRWRAEQPVAEPPRDTRTTAPDPASGVNDRDWQLRLLRQLPPRQRAVLVLRFWEDLDVAETARVLGISTGTVKRQTFDGLATLRQALGEQNGDHQMESQP
ncbi:MAG TPA: SigE family RNA polymerase sigma factor [Mycobacteriales bacterium]|nr:SigE family RNA polymerase sigma factor [Mycobacteriales bacterium]